MLRFEWPIYVCRYREEYRWVGYGCSEVGWWFEGYSVGRERMGLDTWVEFGSQMDSHTPFLHQDVNGVVCCRWIVDCWLWFFFLPPDSSPFHLIDIMSCHTASWHHESIFFTPSQHCISFFAWYHSHCNFSHPSITYPWEYMSDQVHTVWWIDDDYRASGTFISDGDIYVEWVNRPTGNTPERPSSPSLGDMDCMYGPHRRWEACLQFLAAWISL